MLVTMMTTKTGKSSSFRANNESDANVDIDTRTAWTMEEEETTVAEVIRASSVGWVR